MGVRHALKYGGRDGHLKTKTTTMKNLRLLLLIALLGCVHTRSHAQLLALKSNVLFDAATVPNLSMEIITGGKTSIVGTAFGSKKVWSWDIQTMGVMAEFRYWFNGRPLTREFIGTSLMAATYDITLGGKRRKGDAYAGALTFGYDLVLSPHWSVEFHSGVGLLYYDQQRYYIGDRIHDFYYNARGFHLVPYNIGVTFAWILK